MTVTAPGYNLIPEWPRFKVLSVRTIAFLPQKGGCGKSTLAACLTVAAQEAGERVFVLDLDPKKSIV